ncbi:unnamed protein product [Schistosoma curassoni]|uniref:DoxX family protein n=1 Tax=Schistosoma curassoni TaxID=6186 RepID=A0A183L6V6_9TREM|nr:unnamed protein product [Schistosoma curassoni]
MTTFNLKKIKHQIMTLMGLITTYRMFHPVKW